MTYDLCKISTITSGNHGIEFQELRNKLISISIFFLYVYILLLRKHILFVLKFFYKHREATKYIVYKNKQSTMRHHSNQDNELIINGFGYFAYKLSGEC